MISSELLEQDTLRDIVMEEFGGIIHGQRIRTETRLDEFTQAASIAFFQMAIDQNPGDVTDVLNDHNRRKRFRQLVRDGVYPFDVYARKEQPLPNNDVMEGLVSSEEGDVEELSLTTLNEELNNNGSLVIVQGNERPTREIEFLRHVCSPELYLIARIFGGDSIRRILNPREGDALADLEERVVLFLKGVSRALKGPAPQTRRTKFDIRLGYEAAIINTYEEVRTGKARWTEFVSGWGPERRYLTTNQLNREILIRHYTETVVLPHFGVDLKDLPLVKGLKNFINSGILRSIYSAIGSVEDFFKAGYPNMREAPHWHSYRWYHQNIPKGKQEEYKDWRLQFVFEHRLGCLTKQDVINLLNNPTRLHQVMKEEHLSHLLERGTDLPLARVRNLSGSMYDIAPYELQANCPQNTWRHEDGRLNIDNIVGFCEFIEGSKGVALKDLKPSELLRDPNLRSKYRGLTYVLKEATGTRSHTALVNLYETNKLLLKAG